MHKVGWKEVANHMQRRKHQSHTHNASNPTQTRLCLSGVSAVRNRGEPGRKAAQASRLGCSRETSSTTHSGQLAKTACQLLQHTCNTVVRAHTHRLRTSNVPVEHVRRPAASTAGQLIITLSHTTTEETHSHNTSPTNNTSACRHTLTHTHASTKACFHVLLLTGAHSVSITAAQAPTNSSCLLHCSP